MTNEPASPPANPTRCDRVERSAWATRGGPMPARLARHVARCPHCARDARQLDQAHAALTLMCAHAVPVRLQHAANSRALRMLRRIERASAQARKLLTIRPDLSPWKRAQLHAVRVSMSAAAGFLILLARAGFISGIHRTQDLGQQLASAHFDRHIDPDHEWLDPPGLA